MEKQYPGLRIAYYTHQSNMTGTRQQNDFAKCVRKIAGGNVVETDYGDGKTLYTVRDQDVIFAIIVNQDRAKYSKICDSLGREYFYQVESGMLKASTVVKAALRLLPNWTDIDDVCALLFPFKTFANRAYVEMILSGMVESGEICSADRTGQIVQVNNGDRKETRWFSYSSKYEHKLLLQTVSAVVKSATFSEHSERVNGRLNDRKAGFELTHAQHIEVTRKYAAYKNALAAEMDRTYQAFIHKNHIYGTTSEKTLDDYTPEEIAEFEAMFRRAATMDGVRVHAELSAGK